MYGRIRPCADRMLSKLSTTFFGCILRVNISDVNMKVGRNAECPCGSGLKHKHCCLGRIDWDSLTDAPLAVASRYFTIRGKNIQFVNSLLRALEIDHNERNLNFAQIKRAFTPQVVEKVFLSILDLWPDLADYELCIAPERDSLTALFTGRYEPLAILRAITRLSLYCDRIYLVDPFLRPDRVRNEFNPLLHPAEHRATTIKFAFLWLSLIPWIYAGIVSFIRPMDDFIPGLSQEMYRLEDERAQANPEYRRELDEEIQREIKRIGPLDRGIGELYILSFPDEALRKMFPGFQEQTKSDAFQSADEFIAYIQSRRDRHPYFVERMPGQTREFHIESSGACYELAKRMCSLTNSHVVTDLRPRWKEVEIDREASRIDDQAWSPFAKALQASDLKILNNVPLQAALTFREENRLESLRLFLRKVWKSCRDPDQFADVNAINLSAELRDEVAKAEDEWKKIDRDLLKWLGGMGATLVTSGAVGFVPAAAAASITGVTGLIQARIRRSIFKERYPAGFFLGLR